MVQTELIYEALKADLTADRVLLEQVMNYIRDRYGYTNEEFGKFFAEKYPELEEYEVDLAFSPQFTPTSADKLRYMPLLGKEALSTDDASAFVRRMEAEGLKIRFTTADGLASAEVPLHEVMSGRFIKLMKLDLAPDAEIYATIEKTVASECRPMALLLAREEVWHTAPRKELLKAFLALWSEQNSYNGEKFTFLTNFIRTYRPTAPADLKHQLASLIKACQDDMDNVDGRGFHDEYLKTVYAENRGQSHMDDQEKGVWSHYHHMMDMGKLLLEDYNQMAETMPQALEKATQQPV